MEARHLQVLTITRPAETPPGTKEHIVKLIDFARGLCEELAPYSAPARHFAYHAVDNCIKVSCITPTGSRLAEDARRVGCDLFIPPRSVDALATVPLKLIVQSSAWTHAVAEDYLSDTRSQGCEAILRAVAKARKITIED